MTHSGWIASLSNGITVFEQTPELGEMSAWQKLLRELKADGVRITQMRLQKNGTTIVSLPKAQGYVAVYEYTKAVFSGKEMLVQGIGAVVGDVVLMIWANDTGTVWQDIRSLETMRVHSTMDWQI